MLATSMLIRYPDQVRTGLLRRGWAKGRVEAIMQEIAHASGDAELEAISWRLPNMPSPHAPREETLVRQQGSILCETWRKPHWECLAAFHASDPARAVQLTGGHFALLQGDGARLARALTTFLVERSIQFAYNEVDLPLLTTTEILQQTGYVPQQASQLYQIADDMVDALWLCPGAESPVLALHGGQLVPERMLPLSYVTHLPVFHRSLPLNGKLGRSLLKLQQAHQVALVMLTHPDESPTSLDAMANQVGVMFTELGIAWRLIDQATSQLPIMAARALRLDVWMAGMQEWIEVAIMSDCQTYAARRADIRFRPRSGGRPRFVHTITSSGLQVESILAALVETWQEQDGSFRVPPGLTPWMGKNAIVPML